MKTILIALALLAPAGLLADPPHAVIVGPTEGLPGDFIDLSAADSVGDFFEWRVEPAQFTDGRKSFRFPVTADGTPQVPQKSKTCGIASRPGSYKITLIVSNAEGIATKEWAVTIFATPPGAPATPAVPVTPAVPTTPAVPVTPVTPQTPATLGLAPWVQSNLGLVTGDPQVATTRKALAGVYRTWSAAGGTSANYTIYAQGQQLLIQAALAQAGVATAWDPFMSALATKLASLNLLTVPQNQAASSEIANGLEQ